MRDDDAYRLIRACFESLDEARELLRREPALVCALTGLGETPLHFLAVEDQLDAVKLLVEHGAKIDTLNRFGDSALAETASLGHVETLAWMLAKRRDAGAARAGRAHAARGRAQRQRRGRSHAAGRGRRRGRPRFAGMHALACRRRGRRARRRHPRPAAAGADIDHVSLFDETPLDHARRMGANACADVLVRLGARGSERAS